MIIYVLVCVCVCVCVCVIALLRETGQIGTYRHVTLSAEPQAARYSVPLTAVPTKRSGR